MFHKAVDLKFKDGTLFDVTFQDGLIKRYDISVLFDKYPQLMALNDRKLFTSGKLLGTYGIVWSDDLDLEVESVYQDGKTVGRVSIISNMVAADAVRSARALAGISQKELSERCGIDQSEISKIERGIANPSVTILDRIAKALDARLLISIEK